MSSNNNGANTPNFASSVDVDLQKGFLVIGIVLAFLTALVVLRFCCVQFIDIVIMRDTDSLIRSLSQTRRYIFPWWHLRTHAQEEDAANNDESEFTMEILLTGLTRQQKQELLSSILASKVSSGRNLLPQTVIFKYCTCQHTFLLRTHYECNIFLKKRSQRRKI